MKKIFGVVLLAVVAATSLGACSYGAKNLATETHQTIESKLVKGKTTKAEVKAMFGEPQEVSNKKGQETWGYHYTKTSGKEWVPFYVTITGNADGKARVLEIVFNKRGVVQSYEFAEMKV